MRFFEIFPLKIKTLAVFKYVEKKKTTSVLHLLLFKHILELEIIFYDTHYVSAHANRKEVKF